MFKTQFFLGPMTKNVVDCCIEYANTFNFPLTFIPSRRQIEYNGGYVNNWTTEQFVEYVRSKTNKIKIERDHGGAGQGFVDDDGMLSLSEDCKYMDIIHIDPWKKYQNYEEGLNETIKELTHCYNLNPNLYFEIATEEGIRNFEVDELERFILDLKKILNPDIYDRIKYFVIQCGTGLLETTNIGKYNRERLSKMVSLCKKYNFISKEHNGDWIDESTIKDKFDLGLNCINIAPELGEIETRVILNEIKNISDEDKKNDLFNKFYNICYKSNRWKKWVSNTFVPSENKEKIILIAGHYVLSDPEFLILKGNIINVDEIIKSKIFEKLKKYYRISDSYYKVLITTSGTGSRLGDMTKYTNKSLLKIGDKFAISHIIEKYNKHCDFVITLGYYGEFVKDFLELAYPYHNFTFVWVDKYHGEGSSLGYSLLYAKEELNCQFIFHCCDCIVLDAIHIPTENTLFVNSRRNNSLYATINKLNTNNIKSINKKGESQFDYSYIGIAFIKDYNEFWSSLNLLYESDRNSISLGDVDVHKTMLESLKLSYNYLIVNNWYDTGNILEVNDVIMNTFKCKYNVLNKNDESICFFDNFVIKFFYDNSICQNRIKRGKLLGNLVPDILDSRENFIKMKLIDGLLMSNNYESGEIKKLLEWSNKHLWKSIDLSSIDLPQNVDMKTLCFEFYKTKTLKRIDTYLQSSNDLEIINNTNVGNIYDLIDKIDFNDICNSSPCIFHGDFILDNILKCGNNNYKLIDWRQDFSGRIDLGDKYYDLAKLRHNIFLNHENILNNLFVLEYFDKSSVVIDLKCNFMHINQLNDFDTFVIENGLNLKKIKIISSLIWINMASLHHNPFNDFLFLFGKYNLFNNL